MEREQWMVRVHRRQGEEMRLCLLSEGILDQGLKIRAEGEDLLLPVIRPGAERARFEVRDPVPELPRHELIGGIAIMLEDDPEAARRLLRLRPGVHTVLCPESDVEGEFRTRRFAVLAGRPTMATIHREFGNRYEIDLSLATSRPGLRRRGSGCSPSWNRESVCSTCSPGSGPFQSPLRNKRAL
jgi:tRNA (guanine37-N1)-methyltransferase